MIWTCLQKRILTIGSYIEIFIDGECCGRITIGTDTETDKAAWFVMSLMGATCFATFPEKSVELYQKLERVLAINSINIDPLVPVYLYSCKRCNTNMWTKWGMSELYQQFGLSDSEAMKALKTGHIKECSISKASAIRKEVPISKQDSIGKKGIAKKVIKK